MVTILAILAQAPSTASMARIIAYDAVRGSLRRPSIGEHHGPSGGYTLLFRFGNHTGFGPAGGLTIGSDGKLYGATTYGGQVDSTFPLGCGTLFSYDPDAHHYSIVHKFNCEQGAAPNGPPLLAPDGWFYGTTGEGVGATAAGILFRMRPNGSHFTVLHTFGGVGDGVQPLAPLTAAPDGTLFGSTVGGGSAQVGVLFRIGERGQNYKVMHTFTGKADGLGPRGALILGSDGRLYGPAFGYSEQTCGSVFAISRDGSNFTVLRRAAQGGECGPWSIIESPPGRLVVAAVGGGNSNGSIFSLSLDGRDVVGLHAFEGKDGSAPDTIVVGPRGWLFGACDTGGRHGSGAHGTGGGVIFRVRNDGSGFAVVHDFNVKQDGLYPFGLTLSMASGALFGTTVNGGSHLHFIGPGYGTIFMQSP